MDQDKRDKRRQGAWRQAKFTLFSISAGVIQLASFTLLNEVIIRDIGSKYGWSYFISLVLSVVWNFTLNREFTFKSAANVPVAMLKVFGYYAVFTPLSIWWGIALERVGWNEYLILGITMLINFVTEYLFTKFVVYRGQEDTNKLAKRQAEKRKQKFNQQSNQTITADQPEQK